MSSISKRAAIVIVASTAGAAAGALAGIAGGRLAALEHAQARLKTFCDRVMREGEISAQEAREVLAQADASPYPFCSEPEIAWLRRRIFESQYLKEAGRVRAGHIQCSAMLGRLEVPVPAAAADFTQRDGIRLYRNLPPFLVAGQTVISMQKGDTYVAYSPWNPKDIGASPMHFTVSDRDMPSGRTGRLAGEQSSAPEQVLFEQGKHRQGGQIFFTECSAQSGACYTTTISVREALEWNRFEFGACVAGGALCGAFAGLASSLLYRRRRSLASQLRRSIAHGRLALVYQPIVDLASGHILGAEALARWTDDDGHKVSPEVFVRIAEDRGFMGQLTEFVIRRALSDFAASLARRPEFHISVNVSAADLADPRFLPMLDDALKRNKVKPQSLSLELTEGSAARQTLAYDVIQDLRRLGHSIHIDDFGTGYSSLSYLSALSVDAIKIDKSFTRSIGTYSVTVGILPQILSMAETLKLAVIVEGIETAEQAQYFRQLDQRILGQGWYFGRPTGALEFQQMLEADEKKQAEHRTLSYL